MSTPTNIELCILYVIGNQSKSLPILILVSHVVVKILLYVLILRTHHQKTSSSLEIRPSFTSSSLWNSTCIKWMYNDFYLYHLCHFNIRADLTLSYFVILFFNYLQGLHVQFTLSSSKIHFSSTMRIHVTCHVPSETTWCILSIHGCFIFIFIFLHVQITSSIVWSKTHD